MIIGFYPGGGGNRYYLQAQGVTEFETGKAYDHMVKKQYPEYRYIRNDSEFKDLPVILTHCVNSPVLKKIFPGHDIILISSDLKKSLEREWQLLGRALYQSRTDNFSISRIEHYHAFKDESWPTINDEADLLTLPENIRLELDHDYQAVLQENNIDNRSLKTLKDRIISEIDAAYETITWHKRYYFEYPFDDTFATTIIDIDNGHDDFSQQMRKEFECCGSDIFDRVWNFIIDNE